MICVKCEVNIGVSGLGLKLIMLGGEHGTTKLVYFIFLAKENDHHPKNISLNWHVALVQIDWVQLLLELLRVCLFRGEIGWIESFGEKIGRETFLDCVWLCEKEGK